MLLWGSNPGRDLPAKVEPSGDSATLKPNSSFAPVSDVAVEIDEAQRDVWIAHRGFLRYQDSRR